MGVVPTILEKEFLRAEEKINLVKDVVDWIQIDVIDGKFTSGKTFELELLTRIKNIEACLFDIHLMVENPQKWINKCLFVGASRIIGHIEAIEDRDEFVKLVKNEGVEAGLAIEIDSNIDENIPDETDVVLLMARKAGFGDYQFDEKIFDRIKEIVVIRQKLGLKFLIGVDGGIRKENVKRLVEAGVDIAYCGSSVFNGDIVNNLENLKK